MTKNVGLITYVNSATEVYDIEGVTAICLGIFVGVYIINYVCQKITVIKLNKELNKTKE